MYTLLYAKYISIDKEKRKRKGALVSKSQEAGTEWRPGTEEAYEGALTYKPCLALRTKEGKEVSP